MEVIKKYITLNIVNPPSEFLVVLPMEIHATYVKDADPAEITPRAIAVYSFKGFEMESPHNPLYEFRGVRII